MALTATTVTNAITSTDTTFVVGSTAAASAPNFTSGSTVANPGAGVIWAYCDQEFMLVMEVPVSGTIRVLRGQLGTQAASHSASAPITFGYGTDFAGQPLGAAAYQPLYGAPPVPLRAGAAQSTFTTTMTQSTGWGFLTSTAADAAIAMLVEIRASLVAWGLWKGSA